MYSNPFAAHYFFTAFLKQFRQVENLNSCIYERKISKITNKSYTQYYIYKAIICNLISA
jgi:hypothetical protein